MKIKIFGINIEVKEVKGFEKFLGLMFRTKNTQALFFDKASSIHSLFCPWFYALWLDKNKKIIQINKVRPGRLNVSCKEAEYLIEIPINTKYEKIIKIIDEKRERFKY